jgi:hypothetical protein
MWRIVSLGVGKYAMTEKIYTIELLDHNMVEITLKQQIYLDIAITDAIDEDLQRLAPDKKVYQLVIAKGPYIVNPEMRNSFSKGDTGIKQIAIAWVSPDEKSNQEQEAILSKLPLPVKIRFFGNRQSGLDWLVSLSNG